ncbi:DUF4126 domain-containing protein [Arcticibacterium luteifluviistationis]|uniref:DUF4126 domain-containing protein n=1 Tax=Arcticibacterium luteifluviistationis TaxID=1784714 RepID=A0A2Z4GAM1_9BACT|nr:DUF4126 domain-containing protein [Arcticibacterium luteifluviistationis]AWV98171.1 DUF4126 domain-containing protein [Arcticibacterium luteifluviistationis]
MSFSSEEIATLIPALLLGVGLSAASGFRVFLPLLVGNLAGKFGVYELADNMVWMGDSTTTIVLAVAAVFELAAYYIPVVDNLLDTIAMPVAIAAGTILTSSFLQIDDPMLQWGLGLVAGGGVAGTIQAGTSLLRLGSTKFTGGLGNNLIASVENGFSAVLAIVALMLPIFIGAIVLYFVIWIWRRLIKQRRQKVNV